MFARNLGVRWPALLLAAALSFGTTTVTTIAFAEPTEEEVEKGRDLAKSAMGHYKEGEYEDANNLFEEARAVYPTGQVLRMSGYTLMALEKWLDAAEMLEKALAAEYKPLLPRDAEDTQDNLKEVMGHIVVVEVISGVAGAELMIDGGEPIALPHKQRLLPGTYMLEVNADKHDPVEKEITVEGGESVQYKLSPIPSDDSRPPPPPPPDKPDPVPDEPEEPSNAYGWFPGQGVIGLSAAGLGLVAGAIGIGLGGHGASLRSAVQDNIDAHNENYDASCSRNRNLCLTDIELINNDGARAQDYTTAGLAIGITGAALFAVGTTLFLFSDMSPLAPDEQGPEGANDNTGFRGSCGVSLGGVSCAGSF